MRGPAAGRIAVWVDCPCGAEVEFSDLDDMAPSVIPCKVCGRRIEVTVDLLLRLRGPVGQG